LKRTLRANDPATPALKTSLVGETDMILPQDETVGRAGVDAWLCIAGSTEILIESNVGLLGLDIFVQRKFFFYFHVIFLITQRSDSNRAIPTLFLRTSLAILRA
jgi:hypothetical protein